MNFRTIKKIPTAEEIIQEFPLSEEGMHRVAQDRQDVKNILSGKDDRKLVIVGPCSAWPYEPVIEFGRRLVEINKEVKDKLKLIMRVYIQKPRTKKGWTGPVNQPNPFTAADIEEGVKYTRSMMVQLIEMGLPIADEALFTHNAKGFLELLSWVAIGARSVEDQEHRVFASSIECPVGMKNTTTGEIEPAVNGIVAAQAEHVAVFSGNQVETLGNKNAHLVLRGGLDRPNYGIDDLRLSKKLLEKNEVENPAIVIDCSHDNCRLDGKKDYSRQAVVIKDIITELSEDEEMKNLVKGFMFESFIKGGNQKATEHTAETIDKDGLSITDPCLGWEETASIIKEMSQKL